jgi:outer membrane protein TolC
VGLSTSLERLDAEVSQTRAKTNYIHAVSMYNIAIAELERAMGKE